MSEDYDKLKDQKDRIVERDRMLDAMPLDMFLQRPDVMPIMNRFYTQLTVQNYDAIKDLIKSALVARVAPG